MKRVQILGAISGLIGIAASGVACWLFLAGLQHAEHDPQTRTALAVAGVLMTMAQVVAFALHGLLPRGSMTRLRRMLLGLAVILLAFEVLTMSLVQWAGVQNARSASIRAQEQAQQLRQMIDSQRATASALRDAAAVQTRSIFPESRRAGIQALADAARIESELRPLVDGVATAASAQRSTALDLLGERGAVAFVVLRSVLISLVGLLMVSAAGRLLAPDREHQAPEQAIPEAEQDAGEAEQAGTVAPALYLSVRESVQAGRVKPSVREIRAAFGGATSAAQAHLRRLEDDGVIQRKPAPKQGYALVEPRAEEAGESAEKSRQDG